MSASLVSNRGQGQRRVPSDRIKTTCLACAHSRLDQTEAPPDQQQRERKQLTERLELSLVDLVDSGSGFSPTRTFCVHVHICVTCLAQGIRPLSCLDLATLLPLLLLLLLLLPFFSFSSPPSPPL